VPTKKRNAAPSGFTLIELLVVIAIIAILAAILFPVFARAREAARQTTCRSNLKQFGAAFAMYKSDYDEAFPFGGWFGAGGGNPTVDRGSDWEETVLPYIKNLGLYTCPSSSDTHDPNVAWDWNRTITDYLFNNFLANGRTAFKESAIVAPADCILLIEGHNDWGRDKCITPFSNGAVLSNNIWCGEYTTHGRCAELITSSMWGGSGNGNTRVWGCPRHNEGVDVLFTDGHVKTANAIGPSKNGTDGRNKLEAALPWNRYGNPKQDAAGQPWDICNP